MRVSLTLERLGASLEAGGDVAAGNALLAGQVVEELLEISLEVALVAGGDEGDDGDVAVGALVDVPLGTGNGRSVNDARAGRGDGEGATVGADPDHDLVGVVGGRGGGEPKIVRDVGDHLGSGVSGQLDKGVWMRTWTFLPPDPSCGNRLDVGDLLVDLFKSHIGVGLDLAGAASPGPAGRPDEGVAVGRGEGGTLGARGGIVSSPVVVVDGVSVGSQRAKSIAPSGVSLLDGLGGSGGSGHSRGSKEGRDNTKELHSDGLNTRLLR